MGKRGGDFASFNVPTALAVLAAVEYHLRHHGPIVLDAVVLWRLDSLANQPRTPKSIPGSIHDGLDIPATVDISPASYRRIPDSHNALGTKLRGHKFFPSDATVDISTASLEDPTTNLSPRHRS